jgi:hypothetical protein
MSSFKRKRHSLRKKGDSPHRSAAKRMELYSDSSIKEKYFDVLVITTLLAFGIYHSVLYFGHQVVPNPDFTGFVRVGHQLLSFQLPSSYKRAPVVGLLQAALSHLVKGPHPDLTAGWLLNAILHPLNIVLLWLLGKRIVGRAAPWVAVIAIINPWTIQSLTEPIAETTLLFFVLLTFYFIFKRSNWSYLLASITTMVRYEGAALILTAFVIDMIYGKNRRERIRCFLYSAMATVPLVLWMLGTFLSWESAGPSHYLRVFKPEYFGGSLEGRVGLVKHMGILWLVGFHPLFPYVGAAKSFVEFFSGISKSVVAVGFFSGAIYGLLKRQREILALLLFFSPYFLLHAIYPYPFPRFHIPIFWIALLLCLYGLQSIWKLINKDNRVPKPIVIALQGLLLISAFVWFILILPYLPKIASISPPSASIPYVTIALVAIIFAARRFIYSARYSWPDLVVSILVCLMIVSNHFSLVQVIGNGQRDIEFKLLADWYNENAKPGEKLLCTLANIVRIFAPQHTSLHTNTIKADNPSDFAQKCLDENITYVAWDSRAGLAPGSEYYKLWGLKNIAMLAEPRSTGPYEFVTQIPVSRNRFINIFRLRKSPPPPPPE